MSRDKCEMDVVVPSLGSAEADTLGARIAVYRKLKNMSQLDLARACGWESQSRIGNYEAMTREPTLADIDKLAMALGVSPVTLAYGAAFTQAADLPPPADPGDKVSSLLDGSFSRVLPKAVQHSRAILAFDLILRAIDDGQLSDEFFDDLDSMVNAVRVRAVNVSSQGFRNEQ